jgi:uncharacterized protein
VPIVLRLLISAAISGAIHYYVWSRLAKRTELPRAWRRGTLIATALLWIAIPITTALRNVNADVATAMSWVVMPWMALVAMAFLALLALDAAWLVAGLVRRARKAPPPDLSRRRFLARVTGATAATVAGASVARGMVTARGVHEVVDVEVKLAKLPKALDGFTIVQLTDLHIGLTIDRDFVQRVVDITNDLQPDVIALTGDFVDGKVHDLADEVAPLANLRAKHGVFAVTGNHEYYSGAEPWVAHISTLGVRYLRNERVSMGSASGADGFDLAGVEDYTAAGKYKEDLAAATAGRDPSRALVLLAHQPRQVRRAAKHGVDLQLSGHTHGGQIWPWHYIVKIQQGGLLAGRYQHGDTQLYVSRGCGYWGPPVRLLAPLEITRVILRAV